MNELEFWQAVYVAHIRSGGTDKAASYIADKAIEHMKIVRPNLASNDDWLEE